MNSLALIFVATTTSFGSLVPASVPENLRAGADDCMRAMYEGRVDDAVRGAENLLAGHPDQPSAHLLYVSALQAQLEARPGRDLERAFRAAVGRAQSAARKVIQKQPRDYWGRYALAGATGALALQELHTRQWLPALRHAWTGVTILRQLQADYPNQVDIEFGMGCYEYWVSRYTGFPRGGEGALEGIRKLYKVLRGGDCAKYAAARELKRILHEEKRFSELGALTVGASIAATEPGQSIVAYAERQ